MIVAAGDRATGPWRMAVAETTGAPVRYRRIASCPLLRTAAWLQACRQRIVAVAAESAVYMGRQ